MSTLPALQSVLVLRTDKIGDLLVSTPAIRNLRCALPDARITLVTSPSCADVLRGWDAIDAIEAFDEAGTRQARAQAIGRLRGSRPDIIFAFTPKSSVYMLARRIGARTRVGFGYRSRPLDAAVARFAFTHPVFTRVPEAVARAHEVPHHAEELMALLPAVGLPVTPGRMEVPIADANRDWAGRALAERGHAAPIVLHLSHKWLDDGWSARDVVSLLDGLVRTVGDHRLVATVGPADATLWREVRPILGAEAGGILVFDEVTFGRWAAVVAAATLVISTDTAAIHLASATGRPVVGVYAVHRFHLFSRQWGPWMVPSRTLPKERGRLGIEAVIESARSLLHEISGEW